MDQTIEKQLGDQPQHWLVRLNNSARGFAIRNSPDWLLNNQMRVNSAAGFGFFACNLMASGVTSSKLRNNPYRFATVPLGLVAMGNGILFNERRYSQDETDQMRAMPLSQHLKQSVKDGLSIGHDPFKTNGVIGLGISGLQAASYLDEKNPAFWGELARAGATGASASAMLGMRDPANAWQVRSAIYFSTIPADLLANWKLWRESSNLDAKIKGRWLFTGAMCSGIGHVMSFFIGGAPKVDMPDQQLQDAQRVGRVAEHTTEKIQK